MLKNIYSNKYYICINQYIRIVVSPQFILIICDVSIYYRRATASTYLVAWNLKSETLLGESALLTSAQLERRQRALAVPAAISALLTHELLSSNKLASLCAKKHYTRCTPLVLLSHWLTFAIAKSPRNVIQHISTTAMSKSSTWSILAYFLSCSAVHLIAFTRTFVY